MSDDISRRVKECAQSERKFTEKRTTSKGGKPGRQSISLVTRRSDAEITEVSQKERSKDGKSASAEIENPQSRSEDSATEHLTISLSPELKQKDTAHVSLSGKPSCLAYDKHKKLLAIGFEDGRIAIGNPMKFCDYTLMKKADKRPIDKIIFYEGVSQEDICVAAMSGGTLMMVYGRPDQFKTILIPVDSTKCTALFYLNGLLFIGTQRGHIYTLNTRPQSNRKIVSIYPKGNPVGQNETGEVVTFLESNYTKFPMDTVVSAVFSSGFCACFQRPNRDANSPLCLIHSVKLEQKKVIHAWWSEKKEVHVASQNGFVTKWNIIQTSPKRHKKSSPSTTLDIMRSVTSSNKIFLAYTEFDDSGSKFTLRTTEHWDSRKWSCSFDSRIVEFIPMPSASKHDIHFATITQNEFEILKVSRPALPSLPSLSLQVVPIDYIRIFHVATSDVTVVQHCGMCTEEFVSRMQKFMSDILPKQVQRDTMPKLELFVTGHGDGTVRLWTRGDVKPCFRLKTDSYFNKGVKPRPVTSVKLSVDQQTILVAVENCHVLLFKCKEYNPEPKPKSLEVKLSVPSGDTQTEGSLNKLCLPNDPKIQLVHHFWCNYTVDSRGIEVNCMDYSSKLNMLSIGTNRGLIVVDTELNKAVKLYFCDRILLRESGIGRRFTLRVPSGTECNVTCLKTLSSKLWVGTKTGELGIFNISRTSENELSFEKSDLGKRLKKEILSINQICTGASGLDQAKVYITTRDKIMSCDGTKPIKAGRNGHFLESGVFKSKDQDLLFSLEDVRGLLVHKPGGHTTEVPNIKKAKYYSVACGGEYGRTAVLLESGDIRFSIVTASNDIKSTT